MINKILTKTFTYANNNKLFLLILLAGFMLRVYKYDELFLYGHDHDLAGWFVRDVVFNKHLRLIGQETSTSGIYIGPIYYYLLIPFYFLTNFDPIGGVIFITLFGLFSIWSIYYVFGRIFGKKEALIAAFIYAVSYYIVINDRQVFPTTPVITWSIWYLYSLHLILEHKFKRGFLLVGILLGLIWHLNVALVLLLPLILLATYLSKKMPKLNSLIPGTIAFVLLSVPLVMFEIKHGFGQLNALLNSFQNDQGSIYSGTEQVSRVLYILGKNLSILLLGNFDLLRPTYLLLFLLLVFMFMATKKILNKNHVHISIFWMLFYIIFFSLYSKNISEYYLNGTIVIFVFFLTVFLSLLIKNTKTKIIGVLLLLIFLLLNLYSFLNQNINRSGYLERKQIVEMIKNDSTKNNYPCVAVSFITEPGYDLGYRYFLWIDELKLKKPASLAPVYTIVFPLRDDIEVDETAGAIGLIYPDHSSYNTVGIEVSCEGDDVNLTEPMWGLPM